jgi:ubiquinone/menaquinone biosynthesis C-methylase UbiE
MSKFGEYLSNQCGNPHGLIGRIMTWAMNRANNAMYRGIVDELEIQDNLRILDVGFGNGYLETLIMKKRKCYIEGIDISEDMVKKAISMNHKYVEAGNMKFKLGDCCSMDYKDGSFDIVTTMNTIYFWEDTRKGMSEVYRVLKSGGVFYNAVITKENLDSIFYTQSGFKKFKNEEYMEIGRDAGFVNVEIKPLGHRYGLLIICRK